MTHDSVQPLLWMLAGSLAFACMGTLAHEASTVFPWPLVALARCIVPLVLVAALALAAGVRLVFFRPRILWMRSIAGSLSLVCTFYALTRPGVPVSDVFTVTNMFPIWVALLSWPLLGEIPSGGVWVSILAGLAGVALIQQPHLAEGNLAVVVALGASLTTALAMIGLHRLQGIDIRAVVVHFSMVSLAFALAAWWANGAPSPWPDGESPALGWWLVLLGVGVVATFGQLFLTKAFTSGAPARVSVVGLTQVVFSLALESFLLQRRPSPWSLAGIPLVLAPTAWLLLRRRAVPSPAEELTTAPDSAVPVAPTEGEPSQASDAPPASPVPCDPATRPGQV